MAAVCLFPSLPSACGARVRGTVATPVFSSEVSPCSTRCAQSRAVVRCGPSGARNFPRGSVGTPQSASGLYLPFLKPSETTIDDAVSSEGQQMSTAEQLALLEQRNGFWHEHAPLLESLKRAGVSPPAIMEATGMTGVEQNALTVAAQVRSTLVSLGLSAPLLAFFDLGGDTVLYELRVLAGQQRKEAAEYVAERQLDAKSAREVARAMKEFERRRREPARTNFSAIPGDCLAYSLYRQAVELKGMGDGEGTLKTAIEAATSESARAFLSAILSHDNPTAAAVTAATGGSVPASSPSSSSSAAAASAAASVPLQVPVVRLKTDGSSFRPIPIVSTAEQLQTLAPTPSPSPPFFSFSSPPPSTPWLPVPDFASLQSLSRLAALLLPKAESVPSLVVKGIKGEVMLIIEVFEGEGVGGGEDRQLLVMRDSASGGLTVKEGVAGEERERGEGVAGRVIVVLLPPNLQAEMDEAEWE